MDPERRRLIDDLFDRALDQPLEERTAWIEAHCNDPALRAEVEALLSAHDHEGGILDRNAFDLAGVLLPRPPAERNIERNIGPYHVLREIGRGGMGVVYLADRADGQYRRRVAVKLLRASPDAEELERRFVAERQILASLNHPNIAQLLDGGVSDGHLPYLVMEYVDGVPITTYCDRQRLGIEERLRLFRDVCAAVQHAHQNLVIHRDIKPSNILVTEDRRVKLLDFGIAKLLNPTFGPAQAVTRTEWRVMTPEYASPEQVRGDTLTTASDVYALGVLLYELLSGRRPHRLTSGSPRELAEVIVHREPDFPSVAVSRPDPPSDPDDADTTDTSPEAIARERGTTVERLRRHLEGDLDAIVMMALRKESARRYGSADMLWEDLQRHLDGLPVLAHHSTRWYGARKFLGRHRVEAVAAAVVIVSLVTGASVAVRQAAIAGRERDRAEQALRQSTETADFLVRLFRTPAPPGATRDQVMARDMLATGMTRVEELAGQPLAQAQMLDALGRVNDELGRFDDAERMLRRALELRRAQYGDAHPDVAITLNHLSDVVRQKGGSEEAARLSREALAIQQRVLGPKHPAVALTLRQLGDLTSSRAQAESIFRAARDIQRDALGPDNLAVLTTNTRLADVLSQREAYGDAEALLRENVAISERRQGADHPITATTLMLLANHLYDRGHRPAEAESLYHRALGILRRQPPEYLPNLEAVLTTLSGVYSDRGDHAQAEAYAREALATQRRIWGPTHPMVTDPMGSLAEQLVAQRRYAEAESIYRDVLQILEQSVGSQHNRVALVLIAQARTRSAMGRRDQAEADLRQALAILERTSGSMDPWVGATAALLADQLSRHGENVEAGALFDRAAAILRSLPPQLQPDILAAYAALADHYRATNQSAEEARFRRLARGRSPST